MFNQDIDLNYWRFECRVLTECNVDEINDKVEIECRFLTVCNVDEINDKVEIECCSH